MFYGIYLVFLQEKKLRLTDSLGGIWNQVYVGLNYPGMFLLSFNPSANQSCFWYTLIQTVSLLCSSIKMKSTNCRGNPEMVRWRASRCPHPWVQARCHPTSRKSGQSHPQRPLTGRDDEFLMMSPTGIRWMTRIRVPHHLERKRPTHVVCFLKCLSYRSNKIGLFIPLKSISYNSNTKMCYLYIEGNPHTSNFILSIYQRKILGYFSRLPYPFWTPHTCGELNFIQLEIWPHISIKVSSVG